MRLDHDSQALRTVTDPREFGKVAVTDPQARADLAATLAVAGTVRRGRLSAGCAGPVTTPAASRRSFRARAPRPTG